jgi:hypothetical protein
MSSVNWPKKSGTRPRACSGDNFWGITSNLTRVIGQTQVECNPMLELVDRGLNQELRAPRQRLTVCSDKAKEGRQWTLFGSIS